LVLPKFIKKEAGLGYFLKC